MLRSLYAGISGLRAEQTMLDVTSNNIANVNTVGFKSSSVQFEDTLSQMVSAAGLSTTAKAGTNPNQVGLGVRVAAVTNNLTEGSQTSTGNNLDAMISGDGYFVTQTGSTTQYTRDGSFHWDSLGRLSTADGSLVQGWNAVNGAVSTGGAPTTLTLPSGTVAPANDDDRATMTGNLPSDSTAGTSLERDITVYSADGTARQLTMNLTADATTAGKWNYSISDGTSTAPVTGSLQTSGTGDRHRHGRHEHHGEPEAGDRRRHGRHVRHVRVRDPVDVVVLEAGRQRGRHPAVGLHGWGRHAVRHVQQRRDGRDRPPRDRHLHQPGGAREGGQLNLVETLNSGTARLGTAGSDGYGSVVSGALEASNVDLSQEFTNLIVAQRGFQANARIITTSDSILQELMQLKQ